MLRKSDRKKLDSLAAKEAVSTAEIVRRAIEAYDPSDDDDNELLTQAIVTMRKTLKEAIHHVKDARAAVSETRKQLREHTDGAR